jgi:hypothetical protein
MDTPPPELLAWPWPPADAKAMQIVEKKTNNSFRFIKYPKY